MNYTTGRRILAAMGRDLFFSRFNDSKCVLCAPMNWLVRFGCRRGWEWRRQSKNIRATVEQRRKCVLALAENAGRGSLSDPWGKKSF